jgi:hypothetical protein
VAPAQRHHAYGNDRDAESPALGRKPPSRGLLPCALLHDEGLANLELKEYLVLWHRRLGHGQGVRTAGRLPEDIGPARHNELNERTLAAYTPKCRTYRPSGLRSRVFGEVGSEALKSMPSPMKGLTG